MSAANKRRVLKQQSPADKPPKDDLFSQIMESKKGDKSVQEVKGQSSKSPAKRRGVVRKQPTTEPGHTGDLPDQGDLLKQIMASLDQPEASKSSPQVKGHRSSKTDGNEKTRKLVGFVRLRWVVFIQSPLNPKAITLTPLFLAFSFLYSSHYFLNAFYSTFASQSSNQSIA